MPLAESHIIAPIFQGRINVPDPYAEALLTGVNPLAGNAPYTHNFLSPGVYVRTVASCKEDYPELVQNVARALVAAAFADHKKRVHNVESRLASVDGVLHTVGDGRYSGSSLMHTVWKGVMSYFDLKELIIETSSLCTREEIARLLELRPTPRAAVIAIVHEHRRQHVQMLLREQCAVLCSRVYSPQEIIDHISYGSRKRYDFVRDVVLAAEPTERQNREEQWWNTVVAKPFHRVSRLVEQCTFEKVSPERLLAHMFRKRAPSTESAQAH